MHSKTDAKGLWICNFDKEEDSADEARLLAEYMGSTLEANVPYFVAPYDGANGTDMRGKTYVFSASNVTVKPNPSAITSGTYHMVNGEYAQKTVEDAYFLNNEGSFFVKAATGKVNAFEAYAANIKTSEATQFQIVLDENAEDGPDFLLGDVNNDGKISITDVADLIDYLAMGEEFVTINLDAADVNGDNKVSIADVADLIDLVLGME